jgi:DNA polymerase III delta prime subunit
LPSDNLNTSVETIYPELLINKNSKEFIESFGIKQPSLKDEIYNRILPLYNEDAAIDTEVHFKLFLEFWKEEGRPEDFLNLIKDKAFISYKTSEEEITYRGRANEIYYPYPDLQKYFESKTDTRFVDLDDYYAFITDEKDKTIMKEFLVKLGVSELPRILNKEITDWSEKNSLKSILGDSLRHGSSGYSGQGTFDKIIDGCKEIIASINLYKSLQLWNILDKLKISKLEGVHKYFYYSQQYQYFESTTITLLKTKKWLFSKSNELVAPNDISIDELADKYERNLDLEPLLGFKPIVVLSEAERIAQKFESEEDAELAKRLLEEHKIKQNVKHNPNLSGNENSTDFDENELPKTSKIERTIKDLSELQNQFTQKSENSRNKNEEAESKPEIQFDEDKEFAKGIEDLKKQLEVKKSRVDLVEIINNSIKYSYDWFLAYLKLLTTYGEKQDAAKQKSISFQEIKAFKTDNKYFLLCGASSYITAEIENSDDFKVILVFENGRKESISVEGVSKKGQDLLIYCRESLPSNTLSKLSKIFKVEINFTPVVDLLDRLYKAFTNRNHIDEWQDIQESMPSLNYIYGPPGTGKTTTLCNNINEILDINPNAKFLVLTPTNKAADVVCRKILDINSDVFAVRLSRPTDPELEEEAIYRDTLNGDDIQSINVVASTIHRLPYFDIQNLGILFQYEWDYVIFDESSMTGLHYITFAIMALSKANLKTNFIIAGDPKQIPPVIEIDDKELEDFDFQDENIYKMMGLESFNSEKQTIREIDTIQNLNIQYRSIPQIGQLFSELSYSSLLEHDRAKNKSGAKPLPEKFNNLISSNVTFIDVPLNQDNSIYKVNKLFYSSYHTYCAILVSEIIKYFDSVNESMSWSIGLIAPYKAQAILLNKLITSYGVSEKVKVYTDTVHGFQGDECDIVFFVCNPNNYFYTGHEKALLSKEYIYNVAISRAKDYLIILHPYTAIRNNKFINEIGISYKNNFGNTKIINSNDLEKLLFNDENYIENNSYVSGHESINVFGLSEMKYFIKANDTSIDIQLRNLGNNIIENL